MSALQFVFCILTFCLVKGQKNHDRRRKEKEDNDTSKIINYLQWSDIQFQYI